MSQLQSPNPNLQSSGQNQRPNNNVVQIDLMELFAVIWRNLGQILIVALIFAIIALSGTMLLIKPTYRASFTAFVNNKNGQEDTQSIQSGDVSASQSLTHTYAAIMKSRPVVEEALAQAGLQSNGEEGYEYDNVKDALSTTVETNTQLVSLYVTLKSPEDAYALASAISEIAPNYVSDIVEGSSMKIVSAPILPYTQFAPSPQKNTVIGFLLGAIFMIAIVVIQMITDNRVKSEADLESKFGISIVGSIPNVDEASHGRGGYGGYGGYYKKAVNSAKGHAKTRSRSLNAATAKKVGGDK